MAAAVSSRCLFSPFEPEICGRDDAVKIILLGLFLFLSLPFVDFLASGDSAVGKSKWDFLLLLIGLAHQFAANTGLSRDFWWITSLFLLSFPFPGNSDLNISEPHQDSTYALTLFRYNADIDGEKVAVGESHQFLNNFFDFWSFPSDFWDTAGQERFNNMHPSYYFGAHACVMVAWSCSGVTLSFLPPERFLISPAKRPTKTWANGLRSCKSFEKESRRLWLRTKLTVIFPLDQKFWQYWLQWTCVWRKSHSISLRSGIYPFRSCLPLLARMSQR